MEISIVEPLGANLLTGGQGPLDSLWSSTAALDSSSSLVGVLNALRATGSGSGISRFSGLEVLPTSFNPESDAISKSSPANPGTAASDFNNLNLFSQPVNLRSLDSSSAVDPLTGISASAALVGAGNIQVTTSDSNIVQNRMVFSTVNEEVRTQKTLTVKNTGSGDLTITRLRFGNGETLSEADFRIVNSPTSFTLAPDASQNISVQFVPRGIDKVASLNANDSPTHTKNGEQYDSLQIASDDPDQPVVAVNLAGLNSANYEGNSEPSVAEIARAFGFSVDVGTEDNLLGGSKTLLGDEVYSPYWLRADTSQPVELWPLAVYSGRGNGSHDSIRFEAKPGSGGNSGLIYQLAGRNDDDSPTGTEVKGSNDLSGGENQKLLPKILVGGVNSTPTPATVDFIPTKAFALNRSGSWTDDSKNGTGQLHNWRLYPVGNPATTTTWFATADPGNNPDPATGKNFDYNDNVYLLKNAKPESPQSLALYRFDTATVSGSYYTDTSGKTWSSDVGYTNGVAENSGTPPAAIANTSDDTLYHTYRGKVKTFTYDLPVSQPQNVDLYLQFAEVYWTGAPGRGAAGTGKRVFDVIAEGRTVLDNFDITAAAGGPLRAIQKAIKNVPVNDGILNLQFTSEQASGGVDFPAISAISVLRSPA